MVDWSASSCETLVGQLRDGDRMAWQYGIARGAFSSGGPSRDCGGVTGSRAWSPHGPTPHNARA